MKTSISHRSNLAFNVKIREHEFIIDASPRAGGEDLGPTPKEFLLFAISSCTGMDVVSLMKKMRVEFTHFMVHAEAEPREEHPRIFPSVLLTYEVEGIHAEVEKIQKAVDLSLTRYCGVSAMVSGAVPIKYEIKINGEIKASGQAKFNSP